MSRVKKNRAASAAECARPSWFVQLHPSVAPLQLFFPVPSFISPYLDDLQQLHGEEEEDSAGELSVVGARPDPVGREETDGSEERRHLHGEAQRNRKHLDGEEVGECWETTVENGGGREAAGHCERRALRVRRVPSSLSVRMVAAWLRSGPLLLHTPPHTPHCCTLGVR